jgi:hypothetical protein
MRFLCVLTAVVCLRAQQLPLLNLPEDRERIRQLVAEGVLPRAELQKIALAEAESRDEEILRQTLYGSGGIEELTVEAGEAMLEAAARKLARRQKILADAEKLVAAGAAPRSSLTAYLQEVDRSRKTLTLATMRFNLLQQLRASAEMEQEAIVALEGTPDELPALVERFDGHGVFREDDLRTVILAFEKEFGKALPVSARGDTALHRALGFDHRGRVDVALYPDSPEGVWLRRFLERLGAPYYAFRGPAPGKSTAAHIHIGPPSLRLRRGD